MSLYLFVFPVKNENVVNSTLTTSFEEEYRRDLEELFLPYKKKKSNFKKLSQIRINHKYEMQRA